MSREAATTALKYTVGIVVTVVILVILCSISDEALAAVGAIAFLGIMAYLTARVLTMQ